MSIELRWLKMPKDWEFGRFKLQMKVVNKFDTSEMDWIDVPVVEDVKRCKACNTPIREDSADE